MDTKKNYQSRIQDGDYCNVDSRRADEELMIEDHPHKCIEDKYPADAAAPAAAAAAPVDTEYPADSLSSVSDEPVKKHSAWWVWWAACLAALVLIGSWLFYSRRTDTDYGSNVAFNTSAPVKAVGNTVSAVGNGAVAAGKSVGSAVSGLYSKAASATSAAVKSVAGSAGKAANIIYYFGNDESAVANDNAVLNQAAADIKAADADVTVTAYASTVGNAAYNENLSERRAENIAAYLVAHGVPKDHVKVVGAGASQSFGGGNPSYNRRANIHIDYNS